MLNHKKNEQGGIKNERIEGLEISMTVKNEQVYWILNMREGQKKFIK